MGLVEFRVSTLMSELPAFGRSTTMIPGITLPNKGFFLSVMGAPFPKQRGLGFRLFFVFCSGLFSNGTR